MAGNVRMDRTGNMGGAEGPGPPCPCYLRMPNRRISSA
jgi:hypothetical protein